ncbi:MAG: site-specific integrase [Paludibacteraceae bacterium]|nr:site-specific integrase [Paludibacteraceae bacterium]
MPTIKYRISSRVHNGQAEVLARFYDGEFSQRAKTRIAAPVSAWNDEDGCLVIPRKTTPETVALREKQRQLDELTDTVSNAWWRDRFDVREGWLQKVIDDFHNIPQKKSRLTLHDLCEERNAELQLDAATITKYKVLLSALDRFAGKRTLYVDDFTREDAEAFAAFYRAEPTSNGVVVRSSNTVSGKMRSLRALFSYAVSMGYVSQNPTAQYKIAAEVYGDPIYLTMEERDQLYAFDSLPHHLAVQRDIFIFQCHVGCRVGDLLRLRQENVTEDGWLQYIAHKTRKSLPKTVRVPLSDVALEILARYKEMSGDRLLPFISAQKYNEDIHDCARLAGLDRMVVVLNKQTFDEEQHPLWEVTTSHTARKTFMEAMFRATGSERITSAFTGHADGSRAFARYTHVDDDMKRNALDNLKK